MIFAVWVPLLLPLVAAPAAGRLAAAVPPRVAAWVLVGTAVVPAVCSTAALGLLAGAGALRLPPVAALGHLVLPVVGDEVTVPAACGATAALAVVAVAFVRAVRVHVLFAARARRTADATGTAAGDLIVLDDPGPDAYALPGLPGRPGRIVVTSGMLRALGPGERQALLAHERAHLAGRHHLFVTALALACACHPAFRVLREPLSYALERCADESAAHVVGDRRLTARAIGRAALAGRPGPRPEAVLPAAAGPVPRRVAALLQPPAPSPLRGRGPRLIAMVLVTALSLSAGAALHAAYDLHTAIEIAQGG